MSEAVQIHKAAGILLKDRKLLVDRSNAKEFFIAPCGPIEAGKLAEQALVRQLYEEFGMAVPDGMKVGLILEYDVILALKAAGEIDQRKVMWISAAIHEMQARPG